MAHEIYERVSRRSQSIFFIISETGAAVNTVVDNWIDSYKNNKDSALITLFQFVIESSGCKGEISAVKEDYSTVIRELTLNFNENSSEYPLIQTARKWKVFKNNFCNFLTHLIKQCQNSILYDDYMMPKLIPLLTGLSDSQVRAFRHTSTIAVIKIMTALTDVHNSMVSKKNTALKQYDIEKKKTSERRTHNKLLRLEETAYEFNANILVLEEILTYLFKAVFVLRFRDSYSGIREICISELGKWIIKLPAFFLNDSYLKYLAWSLNDKVSAVRKHTVICLQNIFSTTNLHSCMELFVLKCKERIVSMIFDIDSFVAVEAVALISLINQYYPMAFENKDIEGVYHLVYSENAGVAKAAGQFLSKKLSEDVGDYSIRLQSGCRISSHDIIIKEIVEFFIESELHEHTAYLVDSLIDSCPSLKEWERMSDLLLNETVSFEDSLSSEEERVLIDLMVSTIMQTTTGNPPVGRVSHKKVKTSKDLKNMNTLREKMTYHFIPVLPQLMNKFLSDRDNILNLLQIPLYFDLDLFLVPNHNENVECLLNVLQVIFFKNEDNEVLESCVKVLDFLCNEQYAVASICKTYKNNTVEISVKDLNSAFEAWSQGCLQSDENDLKYKLISSIKKISVLYPYINMNEWGLWKKFFENLEQWANEGILDYSEEFMKYLLKSCFNHILWDLNTIEEQTEAGLSANIPMDEFKLNFNSLLNLTEFLLQNSLDSCAEEAFKTYCDLLLIFGNISLNKFSKHFEGFVPSCCKLRDTLYNFLQKNILCKSNSNDIGDIFRMRILFSSYCKLFTYKILPVYFMSDILPYYVITYSNFGDIIDATVIRAKELDKVDSARAMVNSLINLFVEINKGPSSSSQPFDFEDLRKLSKKFSSLLGFEKKDEIFLKVLHTEGILFSLKESNALDSQEHSLNNLLFFDLIVEFSSRLNKHNKVALLKYLEENLENSNNKELQPIVNYKKSLYI